MEFSQNSEYSRYVGTGHFASNTPRQTLDHQALTRSSRKHILGRLLLSSVVGLTLCVSSLTAQAADTYWPGTERRFAPSIWLGKFMPHWSVSRMNKHWKEWARPYYADWIDPSRGEKMGMWFPAARMKYFYADEDRRPNNPKDPDDPGYDWDWIDRALKSDAVKKDGATINIRLKLEGSGFPDWFEAAGYTIIPDGEDSQVVNWKKSRAAKEMKDFITAFAKRYNRNKHIYTISIDEESGFYRNKTIVAAKADFVKHVAKEFDRVMVVVFQHMDVQKALMGVPGVGWGISDPKLFRKPCGSSKRNFGYKGKPLCDCKKGSYWAALQHNIAIADIPSCSGRNLMAVISSETNGFKIEGSSGSGDTRNPWGQRLPASHEMLRKANLTPAIYAWYHSYKPRGDKKSSNLGYPGSQDPAGIIPAHVIILRPGAGGSKPADWDRAFSTFGKAGTNAILWPPKGFRDKNVSPRVFETPKDFSAYRVYRDTIKLHWKNVGGEKGYSVQWRKKGQDEWQRIKIDRNITKLKHRKLDRETEYQYRIRADRSESKGGDSDWSSIITVKTR